jgi:peptidyl-prolyl cis-trans isomerase B (cyclophilin B)
MLFCALPLVAQDVPGVRTTLVADPTLVSGGQDVTLKLLVDVDKDAQIPASLLTGVALDVKQDDKPGPQVRDGLPGDAKVAVAAGTHFERTIKVPIARLLPAGGASDRMVHLALQWPGMTGANCVVKIAPDLAKVSIDDLDLAKTKVVLVTNLGDLTLAFYPDKAPETVKNFVKLAKEGFYDGTKFHRVIRGFMIQGGDPLTKDDTQEARWGTGGPGYNIKGEVNDTKHVRGVISMANSGSPDTAASQFFICHADAPHLNAGYTAFGALEAGLDTLDKIANVPCGGPQKSSPLQRIVLKQAVVMPAFKNK